MRVLVIEDNRDLAANIGEFLESRGHVIDYALDGLTGLHLAAVNPYDAVVLDLGLPGLDGLTLCRRLREDARRPVPVLMLTARDLEHDKLAGFNAGADDYLVKPFSLPELHARLKAINRRVTGASDVLQVADLSLDIRTLHVHRGGRRIVLTPAQLRLLERLIRASPGVLSRREAENAIWGDDPPESDAALRGHIHALRGAVDHGFSIKLLHTIHGVGYRLVPEDAL